MNYTSKPKRVSSRSGLDSSYGDSLPPSSSCSPRASMVMDDDSDLGITFRASGTATPPRSTTSGAFSRTSSMTTLSSCTLDNRGNTSSHDQHDNCPNLNMSSSTSGIMMSSSGSRATEVGSSESSSNDDTAPTMQDNSSSAQDGKIAIKDVLDIIKFSFILSETDLKIADLSSVPRATHELWHDLKIALISKSFFSNACSKSILDANQDAEKRKNEKMKMELGIRKHNYMDPRACNVGEVFHQVFSDELVQEGLLNSLMPFLIPSRKQLQSSAGSVLSSNSLANSLSSNANISAQNLPSLTVQETTSCRPGSGCDKNSTSRTSRSSSPTTSAESKFNNLSQQLSTPSNGRKLSTPPHLLKSSQFSRTSSSICLINNNNSPTPNPNQLSSPGSSKNSSLSVQHQLRRSVSSSSLTKIAALNRMQLLQQQQRNNTLTATNRINSGSSTNLTGGLFNSSLEVAHEEGRLEIGQSFGSASSNAMRTRNVTIHVCDETRDAKKDFVCRQDLLLSQMGYFRDITTGQSLEDVDISVHCDITIFEWLMAWIKNQDKRDSIFSSEDEGKQLDSSPTRKYNEDGATEKDEDDQSRRPSSQDDYPSLQPENVVSILVSASFLKMEPLVAVGLRYVHSNMNKILSATHNINCLGEPLLSRLAQIYKPSEVEELVDRRDRIHSRLYTKLIISLCDPVAKPERELFHSAATLFRCRLCGLFLTKHLARLLPCLSLRSTVNSRGEVVPKHQRDPTFNLNDFIRTLRLELKSWRKVFWRLWGICHALYCSLCGSYFQVYMHEFCSFHPQDPEFPNIQFKNSTQPCGTYPCCQVAVNRFSPLPPSDKGCQSRDHRVKVRNKTGISEEEMQQQQEIFRLLMAHRDLICLCPIRKSGIKISADANSVTLPNPLPQERNTGGYDDSMTQEVCLIPVQKTRRLIHRTLWDTLRTSVVTGVLRKAGGFAGLVSTLTSANKDSSTSSNSMHALGSTGHNTPNNDSMYGGLSASSSASNLFGSSGFKAAANRIVYGRLRRVPKLPSKPVLQSSESSSATDDLSGSEESNSSSIDDGDGDRDVDPSGGSAGTCRSGSEDEPGPDDFDLLGNGGTSSRDMCIEIKVSKDNDKSKMLQMPGTNAGKQSGQRNVGGLESSSGTNNKGGGSDSASSWMRWNPERTSRTNQDHQREREETSMRLLIKHLARRHRQMAARQNAASGNHKPSSPKSGTQSRWNNLSTSSATGTPVGGTFLKLEQDWRETHIAYLQHRSVSASNAHSVVSSSSSPNLRVSSALTRPGSAASMKSARYTRAAAMHR